MSLRIGIISDTHGLLRPTALHALRGCDHLIHAGDIGSPDILAALRELAPLTVVRGNNDRADWARKLPDVARVVLDATAILVLHDVNELKLDPATEGIDAVISGHSHRPSVTHRGEVLFINPGSAGPRRFSLPIAVATLSLADGHPPTATLIELDA